jgi:hypothetical protein
LPHDLAVAVVLEKSIGGLKIDLEDMQVKNKMLPDDGQLHAGTL